MKWLVASWGWPRFTAETRRSEYNRYQTVQQVGNAKVYACNIIGWKLDSIKFSSWYVTVLSTDIWKRNWKWQFWFRPCLGKRKREMTEFLHTLTKTFHATWYNSRTTNSVCCQQTELRVWKERDGEYPASGIDNEVSLLALLKRGWLYIGWLQAPWAEYYYVVKTTAINIPPLNSPFHDEDLGRFDTPVLDSWYNVKNSVILNPRILLFLRRCKAENVISYLQVQM
jgi:hypothetical protein